MKAVKHKYDMWKDYLERNNERITKWNARAREVQKKKIYNIIIAAKQGVLEDFWFKPYIGKFSGEKFAKEYVQKQHVFWFVTLDKQKIYQPLD